MDDPFEPGVAIDHLTALCGGVATSSTLRRRWASPNGESAHHLIDPTTGWSCATDVVAVTVLADSCANAEVLATQFVLIGADSALATAHFFQAGTDHRRAPALLAVVVMTGLNLGLLSFRILADPLARRAVGRPPRVAPADPQACNDVVS